MAAEGWRRGHRYGTVLGDVEKNEVVDFLLDRDAATVATGLRDHPGVEIVARDRAGVYADGVRQSAPGAVQVADRWHLLRNLGDAVQALSDRFSAAAGRAADGVRPYLLATAASNFSSARLHALGVSISRIAAELGAERKTLRRWFRLGHAPLWKHPARETMLNS